ncbi:MAG: sensor domain-containing diguanylate cyclase [Alphaproteobacteria bacterium]
MLVFSALRTKLNLIVALILVGGFLVTNIISYQVSKGALTTTILENELPLSSNNIYSEIQTDLLQPISVSSQMANNTFLKDWVLEGETEPERMTRFLKSIRERYDAFTSYFISVRTLQYYHFDGLSRIVSKSDPDDGWFFRARDMKEPYEVNVDTNLEQNRAITIFINYRVLDYDGNFIGVAGIGLAVNSVRELIERYQKDFRRSIYFIDADGLVRLHSSAARTTQGNIHNIEGLKDIAGEILAGQRGSFTYQRGGETILLTTRYLPELKWHLLIELNEADATEGLKKSFLINMGIGSVAILLTILMISYTVGIFQSQLEKMATTDKLTGLGNRQLFEESLRHEIARYKRSQTPFALLMIDIDDFKRINDSFGHVAGDVLIEAFADRVLGLVRQSDSVCRWGGDEIAILTPDCTTDDAIQLAEKIRASVAEHSLVDADPEYHVTISVGVSHVLADDDGSDIVARADEALYAAKEKGRNRVESA